MKKSLLTSLIVLSSFSVVGCGAQTESSTIEASENSPEPSPYDTTQAVIDSTKAYVDSFFSIVDRGDFPIEMKCHYAGSLEASSVMLSDLSLFDDKADLAITAIEQEMTEDGFLEEGQSLVQKVLGFSAENCKK